MKSLICCFYRIMNVNHVSIQHLNGKLNVIYVHMHLNRPIFIRLFFHHQKGLLLKMIVTLHLLFLKKTLMVLIGLIIQVQIILQIIIIIILQMMILGILKVISMTLRTAWRIFNFNGVLSFQYLVPLHYRLPMRSLQRTMVLLQALSISLVTALLLLSRVLFMTPHLNGLTINEVRVGLVQHQHQHQQRHQAHLLLVHGHVQHAPLLMKDLHRNVMYVRLPDQKHRTSLKSLIMIIIITFK